jgi:hypothetical protein
MYAFQSAGFNFKFKFRINTSGLACRQLNDAINDLMNREKIEVSDGVVYLTPSGELYYDNVVMTAVEWETVNYITSVFDKMTEAEMLFICITDMFVYDVLKSRGVKGLVTDRDKIQSSVARLSPEYSEENFDAALKFIRKIKE